MALKFRPITYAKTDLRAFKYTGTAAVREGQFCYLSASSDLNTMACTPWAGSAIPTMVGGATATVFVNKFFPIYREDADPENVGATINTGDFVIGFFGQEYEVDITETQRGFATSWTSVGQLAVLGTGGKLVPIGETNATDLVLGECIGTFNAKWLRIRVL